MFSKFIGSPQTPRLTTRSFDCFENGECKVKYIEVKKIGSGAFGDVYHVIDSKTGNHFALKLMKKLNSKDLENAMKEVNIMKSIKNKNVITIEKDFMIDYDDEKALCIVMKLAETDLNAFIKSHGKLSKYTTFKIFIPLVTSLGQLHKQNIIHRDLKPANILLNVSSFFEVFIADFGLAYQVSHESETLDKRLVGTRGYCAPEILLGNKQNYKVDSYSVGVILYVMLTGDYKFIKESCWEDYIVKYPNILNEKIQDKGIRELLCSLLCSDPEERLSLYSLSQSNYFLGWSHAILGNFDIKLVDRNYVAPFVTLTKCSSINQVFPALCRLLRDEEHTKLLLEYSIIKNLCQIIKNAPQDESVRNRHMMINDIHRHYTKAPVDLLGIYLLEKILSIENIRVYVVNEIIVNGYIGLLVEKFKHKELLMDSIMYSICSIHFVSELLLSNYGFQQIVQGFMNDGDFANDIYILLSNHVDFIDNSISLFLKKKQYFTSVMDLLLYSDLTNQFINPNNMEEWSNLFKTINVDMTSITCILRLIYPMYEIYQYIINTYQCIRSLGYCSKEMIQSNSICKSCIHHDYEEHSYADFGCQCKCDITQLTNHVSFESLKNKSQYKIDLHSIDNIYKKTKGSKSKYRFKDKNGNRHFIVQHFGIEVNHVSNDIQFYIEVKVKKSSNYLSFGITNSSIPGYSDNKLGSKNGEISYSNDGTIRNSHGNIDVEQGLEYGFNDIIGIGITGDGHVFFTKNGFLIVNTKIQLQNNSIYYIAAGMSGSCNFSFNYDFNTFVYNPSNYKSWKINELAIEAILHDDLIMENICSNVNTQSSNVLEGIGLILHAIKLCNNTKYDTLLNQFPELSNLSYPTLFSNFTCKEASNPIKEEQSIPTPKIESKTEMEQDTNIKNDIYDANTVFVTYEGTTCQVTLPQIITPQEMKRVCANRFNQNATDIIVQFHDGNSFRELTSGAIIAFNTGNGNFPKNLRVISQIKNI